jgi:DNA polymerase elongation subunit (family B)
MVKIKSIKRVNYKGNIYDLTLKNDKNPYFFVNGIATHNSLYPHIFAQCNLFSPTTTGYNGNGKFKLKGVYNNEQMGKIESLLMEFYAMRNEFKKNKDPREYSVKIIINTSYGLTGNPAFKHLYNPIGAGDCTSLGRQWVMLARERFREAGYEILYTDTDSVYIKDVNNDKNKMLEIKDKLIREIKDNVPFEQDTFDMGIDDEISHMWFFKGKGKNEFDENDFMDDDDFINRNLGLMKKNYIYLTKDDRVVYKNLGVKKKSTSALTRYIFRELLIPKIKEEKKVKWKKSWFEETIQKLLSEDLKLGATRYKVNKAETYKNTNQIQAQISRQYGEGIHFLIKNNKLGVGKGSKYCTMEEFKNNNMRFEDIDLSGVWSELGYFIQEETEQGLDVWGF